MLTAVRVFFSFSFSHLCSFSKRGRGLPFFFSGFSATPLFFNAKTLFFYRLSLHGPRKRAVVKLAQVIQPHSFSYSSSFFFSLLIEWGWCIRGVLSHPPVRNLVFPFFFSLWACAAADVLRWLDSCACAWKGSNRACRSSVQPIYEREVWIDTQRRKNHRGERGATLCSVLSVRLSIELVFGSSSPGFTSYLRAGTELLFSRAASLLQRLFFPNLSFS